MKQALKLAFLMACLALAFLYDTGIQMLIAD